MEARIGQPNRAGRLKKDRKQDISKNKHFQWQISATKQHRAPVFSPRNLIF
jgi:hypothetical protein